MLVLITYDVSTETPSGRKRLAKVAKICCNYGQRVQNSVFECDLDASLLVKVKSSLLKVISEKEDSIRFYNLGNNYKNRIEQFGCKISYDPQDPLLL
jgi:CRISPR-associated protein Cas2